VRERTAGGGVHVEDGLDVLFECEGRGKRAEAVEERAPRRVEGKLLCGRCIHGKDQGRLQRECFPVNRELDWAAQSRADRRLDAGAGIGTREPAHLDSGDLHPRQHRLAQRVRANEQRRSRESKDEREKERGSANAEPANGTREQSGDLGHGSRTIPGGTAAYHFRCVSTKNPLRQLPSVDKLAGDERLAGLAQEHGHELVVQAARAALARARDEIQAGYEPDRLTERVAEELGRLLNPRLRRVLNGTGVVVHTNLGRAPLAKEALARVYEVGRGYSNLEYDLGAGTRGSRQDHLAAALRDLTGAEAALVVNNNAAAVLLALAALAEGKEVVVSRGELVEIGDGFRIPDVLARSGARLVEVGTTNRTRLADYERAIADDTAALLRVHQSNFRIVGFTEQTALRELSKLAERHGLVLVDDLGSGVLTEIGDEPTVRGSLEAGAHLVTFSGDKLLGGPQAGIVVGRADLVERLRRHPLQRAMRADKLTLAALEGTLALYRRGAAPPVVRMLQEGIEAVRARAERLAALSGGRVEPTVARAGGGSLPLAEIESFACALEEGIAARLRVGEPPVVGIVRDGMLLLDCRTLGDDDVEEVAALVASARR
jgi:L-seryl-tRNA(Ser) seleniumtransferase